MKLHVTRSLDPRPNFAASYTTNPYTLSVNIKFNSMSQPALYVALIASVIHLVLSEGATR